MKIPSVEGHLTSLGNLVVEQTEDMHVKVTMKATNPSRMRTSLSDSGSRVVLDMWEGPRPPKVGDEVNVDGSSFAITKVEAYGGDIWVYGDNGRKVRWE